MRKRMLALLLAACMVIGLVPAVMAEGDESGLYVCNVWTMMNGNNTTYEVDTVHKNNIVYGNLGMSSIFAFYYCEGETETLIPYNSNNFTVTEASLSGFITLEPVNGTGYCRVQFEKCGSGKITVTREGSDNLTIPVTVELPEYGFYTAPEAVEANYFSDGAPYNSVPKAEDGKRYLYLVNKNNDACTGVTISQVTWNQGSEQRTVLTQVQPDNANYVQVALPDAGDFGYSLEAKKEDQEWSIASVRVNPIQTSAAHVVGADGADYVVGFGFREGGGNIVIISDGTWSYGDGTSQEKNEKNPRRQWRDFTVYAGIKNESDSYDAAENVTLDVQKMWVELDDSADVGLFSWAENDAVTVITKETSSFTTTQEIENVSQTVHNSAWLYLKEGYAGRATVWATVTITVPGKEAVTEDVSIRVDVRRNMDVSWDRSRLDQSDSMDVLNDFLSEQAAVISENPPSTQTVYTLILDDTTYEGTLIIPAVFANLNGELFIRGAPSGGTTICGGINLNQTTVDGIDNISFKAPDADSQTKAIYDGECVSVNWCTFRGYDVAIDATGGAINPTGRNHFVGNKLALKLDFGASTLNHSRNTWENNSFIGNETAISVVSLSGIYDDPYYLRFVNSNFISNGADFDVPNPGEFFFYRNYFGVLKNGKTADDFLSVVNENSLDPLRGLVDYRAAQYSNTTNKDRVITNPRWALPLLETVNPYDAGNSLVIDESHAVRIQRDLSGDLFISAGAFANLLTPVDIYVVSHDGEKKQNNNLGFFRFPATVLNTMSADGLLKSGRNAIPADFDPYLNTTPIDENTIQAEIHDSKVLQEQKPTLTIPCPENWKGVKVTGSDGKEITDVSFDSSSHEASFPVAAGGTYTIASDDSASFKVTFDAGEGTGTMNVIYAMGDYKLPECAYTAPNGKEFKAWQIEREYNPGDTYTVTADTTVTAVWKDKTATPSGSSGNPTYQIVVEDAENGAVTASKKSASKGDKITLTAIPDENYEMASLIVKNAKGEEIEVTDNTFTMPASKVTVTATFKLINPFEDVSETESYYNAVIWAYYNDPQITNGTDETHFSPEDTVKRGEAVTFLWRAKGEPETTGAEAGFDDLTEDYYMKAVAWAVENGITKGTGDGKFSPEENVTTAQMVTFLYRTMNPGADGWYEEAAAWAEENGYLDGIDLPIDNDTPCPRGIVVEILYNVLAK